MASTKNGNSERTQVGKQLWLSQSDDNLLVYNHKGFLMKKSVKDKFELRLAVVELVKNHEAWKTRLCDFFGEQVKSRQTVNNWIDSYDKYGPQGLINSTKDSWKKNPKRFKGNKARELEQDRKEAAAKEETGEVKINFSRAGKPANQAEKKAEFPKPALYERVHNFEDNRYAGAMLVTAMAEHLYNLSGNSAAIYEGDIYFIYLFMAMHTLQIGSVEQLKTFKKKEIGQITGKVKLESLPLIWSHIHNTVKKQQSEVLKEEMLDGQALSGLVGLDELALDGHFVPYYGKEKVHKGYFTQRDMMMEGQTQMFVHDSNGRVVYFETQEGKGDIVETLKTASEHISDLNDGQKPLIAVDREVWGVENLLYLKYERIVTWEKFSKQERLQEIDKSHFQTPLNKNGREWLLYEETKTFKDAKGNEITLRRILMEDQDSKHRLAVVSTDFHEDKVLISECMLNRWGSNENTFKYTGERTNMHYNPVLDISEESEKQDTLNPDYQELQKTLNKNKKALDKTERELARKPVTTNKDGSLRKNKHREQLQDKRANLKEQISQTQDKMANTPERVDSREIGAKEYKKVAKEGFNLWSTIEAVFWNTRKTLHNKIYEFLPDDRHALPVLESIISAPGRIQTTKDTITLQLDLQETPRFRSAQIQLMRYMNNMSIRLNGKLVQFDKMSNS